MVEFTIARGRPIPGRFRVNLVRTLLLLTGLELCGAEPLRVTAVRFWPQQQGVRVAVETNGEFRYHTERIQNPDRVFFDLFGARPRLGGKAVQTIPVSHPLIRRIRVAETLPGVTRIVLDLNGDADVSSTQLSNPDRLVIEVRPAGTSPAPLPAEPAPRPGKPAPALARRFVPPAPAPQRTPVRLPEPPHLAAGRVGLTEAYQQPALRLPPAPPAAQAAALPQAPVASSGSQQAGPTQGAPVQRAAAAVHSTPARPATRDSEGQQSLIRALGLKINRVVIDPGHGGQDEGTVGPNGLVEKELVLDVSKRLGALIEKRLGAEVIYTRSDDSFVPLEQRTAIANEREADLFLSLHANSSSYRTVAGIETFYLNFTDAKDALEVAARENAGSEKTVHELRDIIQKITLHDKAEESREFAGKMQSSLYSFTARYNPAAQDRGVKKAPFVVLIGAMMPSVLVEIGFVTNPREESLLKRPDHRQRLAEALYRGLSRYSEGLSHFQVAAGAPEKTATKSGPPPNP